MEVRGTSKTYIPEDRMGWWGGRDMRPRCSHDHKVAFTQPEAERSALKACNRGTDMVAYLGKCGHWHTARRKT